MADDAPVLLGALPRISRPRPRLVLLGVLVVTLLAAALVLHDTQRASARGKAWVAQRCQDFRVESRTRAAEQTGPASGSRVLVIGDSWSAGLGLERGVRSWPSRLPGRVGVAGFSGSGFSERASVCGRVSFADRAPAALRGEPGLVVVEGGLNDVDQPRAAVVSGFDRLMSTLVGHRVVVVGPAAAPSRARWVPRVDTLLGDLAASWGVPYVSTDDLRLPYLDDGLHLTEAGHRAFGDAVADRVSRLGGISTLSAR
jgi:acyl-CoA thioesterase-1